MTCIVALLAGLGIAQVRFSDGPAAQSCIQASTESSGIPHSDTIRVRRIPGQGPVIDGCIDPHEWRWSVVYDISRHYPPPPPPPARCYAYFLYDDAAGCMYYGIDCPDYSGRVDYDHFGPYMDEDHSGTWSTDSSEGNCWVEYVGADSCVYRALLSTVPEVWYFGQVPGAQQASSLASGHLQFEARVPLGTEKWAYSVHPGDTVGFFVYVALQGGGNIIGWWPESLTHWADPAYYGPMVFEDTFVGVGGESPQVALPVCRPLPVLVHGSARISWQVSRQTRAELVVYDVRGSHVRTLVSGSVQAGEHEVVWDLTDNRGCRVATGTYFYRHTVDGKSVSSKAVVLK